MKTNKIVAGVLVALCLFSTNVQAMEPDSPILFEEDIDDTNHDNSDNPDDDTLVSDDTSADGVSGSSAEEDEDQTEEDAMSEGAELNEDENSNSENKEDENSSDETEEVDQTEEVDESDGEASLPELEEIETEEDPLEESHTGTPEAVDYKFLNLDKETEFAHLTDSSFSVIYSYDEFLSGVEVSDDKSLMVNPEHGVETSDLILLHFIAYTNDSYGKVRIQVNGSGIDYVLPTQPTEYIYPVSDVSTVKSVKLQFLTESSSVNLGKFEILNAGDETLDKVESGIYDLSDFKNVVLSDDDGMGSVPNDILIDENYLYSISKGVLVVYDISNPNNPSELGFLSGLGNSRDIAQVDHDTLVITARENGVFIVDVSDKYMPFVKSEISTLGLATSCAVSGNFCFIADRKSGVEIYDITDTSYPLLCSEVDVFGKEAYDLCVSGHYLYVSMWANKQVLIYDVSNACTPELISTISLNGCGGGCAVNNNILYVATGYNATNYNSKITAPGYGMGNGMDIFDVSDPANPKWLSTARIDGRYIYSGFDHWRVSVQGRYAYITNIFNGVYIYDVSNPSNPKRCEKIYIDIPESSSNYKNISGTRFLFSFNPSERLQGAVSSVAVADNVLFISACNIPRGIFYVETDNIGEKKENQDDSNIIAYGEKEIILPIDGSSHIILNGPINAVTKKDGY